MRDGTASRTAMMVAAARAAHLAVDGEPAILRDDVVAALLGDAADELVGYHRAHGDHVVLWGTRALGVTRSRFVEDRIAASGVEQYVLLGAGLDTFAFRNSDVRVFEVDHPDTQAWKRELISTAGLAVPEGLEFVPLDLERGGLAERLAAAGFDPRRRTLVGWLGVSVYLSRATVETTVRAVAGLGAELVMDYMVPPGLRDGIGREYGAFADQAVVESGEPYRTFLTPDEAEALVAECGMRTRAHVGMEDAVPAGTWRRDDVLRPFVFSRILDATALT
ncbi:class I SAM-dependent methyltransferase [Actinomadura oligospora]|uniref:class I SAM-dependent methyltransferase n=1 Tax=Actinomadura oligospora TaxID=111804 RepID=UPI0004B49461|nr:class I SAM-dependent methyltransferase [Actinomadura oligospora]